MGSHVYVCELSRDLELLDFVQQGLRLSLREMLPHGLLLTTNTYTHHSYIHTYIHTYIRLQWMPHQQSVHGLRDRRLQIARVHAVREVLALQRLVGGEGHRILKEIDR